MNKFYIYSTIYKNRADVPTTTEEIIPKKYRGLYPDDLSGFITISAPRCMMPFEAMDDETEKRIGNDYIFKRKTKADADEVKIVVLNPEIIPTVEREYLLDLNTLARFDAIKTRPVDILTREECNTKAGRIKLHMWGEGYPNIISSFYLYNPNNWLSDTFFLWAKHNPYTPTGNYHPYDNEKLKLMPNQNSKMWGALWGTGAGRESVSGVYPTRYMDIDLAFAIDFNTEITTREEFRHVVEKNFNASMIPALMLRYEYCKFTIDSLWATYELFRTEKYESIANCPKIIQRTAILNYFATFRYFGSQKKRVDDSIILDYQKPRYVVTNLSKLMGIPSDILTYTRRNIKNPLISFIKDNDATAKEEDGKKSVYVSREPRVQRTNTPQMWDYYEGYKDKTRLKAFDNQTIGEAMPQLICNHTKFLHMYNTIIDAVYSTPNFDIKDVAQQISNAQNSGELEELYNKPYKVEIKPIIKSLHGDVYGQQYKKCLEDFKNKLRNLPEEPFIFFKNVLITNPKGEQTLVHVNVNNKKTFARKEREIFYNAPLMNYEGEIIENGTHYYLIHINPIFFANMINESGELTNYDKLPPRYKEYTEHTKKDSITSAVEKIILRQYIRQFPKAKQAKYSAIKKAKDNGEKKPTAKELEDIKRESRIYSINKIELYNAVKTNAYYEANAKLSTMERKRTLQRIEKALETLTQYQIYIKRYESTPDGRSWLINFIEPV